VQNTRNPAENRETDVDQEIGAAPALEEDRNRWKKEGEEVEEDVRLVVNVRYRSLC